MPKWIVYKNIGGVIGDVMKSFNIKAAIITIGVILSILAAFALLILMLIYVPIFVLIIICVVMFWAIYQIVKDSL